MLLPTIRGVTNWWSLYYVVANVPRLYPQANGKVLESERENAPKLAVPKEYLWKSQEKIAQRK